MDAAWTIKVGTELNVFQDAAKNLWELDINGARDAFSQDGFFGKWKKTSIESMKIGMEEYTGEAETGYIAVDFISDQVKAFAWGLIDLTSRLAETSMLGVAYSYYGTNTQAAGATFDGITSYFDEKSKGFVSGLKFYGELIEEGIEGTSLNNFLDGLVLAGAVSEEASGDSADNDTAANGASGVVLSIDNDGSVCYYGTGITNGTKDTLFDLAGTESGFYIQNDSGGFEEHNFFDKSDFTSSFTSFGYSTDITNAFGTTGWSVFGDDSALFDDFTYNFDGFNFTAFGESDTISLPSWGFNAVQTTLSAFMPFNPLTAALNTYSIYQNFVSPLSFDLDDDGIETTHIYDTNVFFDIDGDGFAEKVGWIAPDDGMLARDVNGDGIINDITELFGDDIMPAYDKLALLDSNGDGVINSSDDAYSDLLVWRDLDQDDYSDANELFALTDAITDFVQITESGSNSYLSVDADGGADNFVQVAYLYNETGLTDEDALETSGNLITV